MWGKPSPTCLGCSSRAEIDSSMIHDGGDWRGGVTLLNGLRRVPLESSGRREHEGNSLMPYWSRWHYYQLRWTERSKSLTLTLPRVSSSPTQTEKRWDVNISRKNHPQAISMREWNYSCDQTTCVNKYYFTPGGEIRYILIWILCIPQSLVSYFVPQIIVQISRWATSRGKVLFFLLCLTIKVWIITLIDYYNL